MSFAGQLLKQTTTAAVAVWLAGTSVAQAETYFVGFGADEYPKLSKSQQLPFCSADVVRMAETLTSRNGLLIKQRMLLMVSGDGGLKFREPTAENLRKQLPEFLRSMKADDTLIVFGSCHGLRDAETGRSSLALSDIDPERPAETSVEMVWLRDQLLNCPADTVVWFLDACHAGGVATTRGGNPSRKAGDAKWTTKEVAAVFSPSKPLSRRPNQLLYALVSSSDAESSTLWLEQQQSLFTFWICRGLEGAADDDRNGRISLDELFNFVERQVPQTKRRLQEGSTPATTQTPQRFLLGQRHGNLELFPIQPDHVRTSLRRVASLAEALIANQVLGQAGKTAVPQVTVLPLMSRHISGAHPDEFSSFGVIAAASLEESLKKQTLENKAFPSFNVVSKSALNSDGGLRAIRVRVRDSQPEATPKQERPLPALILDGSYFRRGKADSPTDPDRLQLDLRLRDDLSGESFGNISTTILIDEEFRALLPEAFDSRKPPLKEVDKLLEDVPNDSPIRLFVRSDKQPIPKAARLLEVESAKKGQPVFAVSQGDEIEIELHNPTDGWVAMHLYIDGLCAIGQRPVPPSEAIPWLFPPGSRLRLAEWLDAERAFEQARGEAEKQRLTGRKFLISAPPDSVAGQRNLWDDIGQIQLIVYPAQFVQTNSHRSVGISEGAKSDRTFQVHRNWAIDSKLRLAQYVLHYVDAKTVN